jgi:hypothetical protein
MVYIYIYIGLSLKNDMNYEYSQLIHNGMNFISRYVFCHSSILTIQFSLMMYIYEIF